MKQAVGTYTVNTHPGLQMINPNYEINQGTKDFFKDKTFQPSITFVIGNSRIFHQLPPQPYVNDSWDDAIVESAIENYLKSIAQ